MKKVKVILKIFLWLALLLLVAAFGWGWYLIAPWVTIPDDLDPQFLEAKLAEYQSHVQSYSHCISEDAEMQTVDRNDMPALFRQFISTDFHSPENNKFLSEMEQWMPIVPYLNESTNGGLCPFCPEELAELPKDIFWSKHGIIGPFLKLQDRIVHFFHPPKPEPGEGLYLETNLIGLKQLLLKKAGDALVKGEYADTVHATAAAFSYGDSLAFCGDTRMTFRINLSDKFFLLNIIRRIPDFQIEELRALGDLLKKDDTCIKDAIRIAKVETAVNARMYESFRYAPVYAEFYVGRSMSAFIACSSENEGLNISRSRGSQLQKEAARTMERLFQNCVD